MKSVEEIIEFITEEISNESDNMDEIRESIGTNNIGFASSLEVKCTLERLLEFILETN